jgi:hypothetical protein
MQTAVKDICLQPGFFKEPLTKPAAEVCPEIGISSTYSRKYRMNGMLLPKITTDDSPIQKQAAFSLACEEQPSLLICGLHRRSRML